MEQAGQILRLPEEWEGFEDELAPDQIEALRREKASFLNQPKAFIIAIATLCVAATVQGWTQTISNGASEFVECEDCPRLTHMMT